MQTITLHNTDTEEIMGIVYPVSPTVDYSFFCDILRKSFIDFHKSEAFNDGDYSIENFVEWHNENNEIEIDWVLNDFIQLSEDDIN